MLPGDRGFIPNEAIEQSNRNPQLASEACVTTLLRPFRTSGDSAGRRLKVEGQPAEHRFLVVFLPNKTVVEPRVSRQF